MCHTYTVQFREKNNLDQWTFWPHNFIFWSFNATFSNISAISWQPVLVVEEAGVPGENHRPWASTLVKFITCGCESSAPFL